MSSEFAGSESNASLLAQYQAWRVANKRIKATELPLGLFLGFSGLVCVAIWAAIWAYIAAFPMAYMDRDYPLSLAKAQLAAECLPGDIAVFGDSRAAAGIMPKTMDMRVTNLAYPGGSPIENYFLVRRLLRCPTPPRLVVLAQSAAMYVGPHAIWNIFAYDGILTPAELSQVKAEGDKLHDDSLYKMPHPSGVPYALLPELYGIRFPPLFFASLLGGYGFARERYNLEALHDIVGASGNVLFGNAPGSDAIADEARMTAWNVTPLINHYLMQTLALLRNHHVPVAIITMPINQATCADLPAVVQARLSRYLDSLTLHDPNVVLVKSTIPCWPDRYYNDKAHFNESGAVAYSKVFEAMIKQALNGPKMKTAEND